MRRSTCAFLASGLLILACGSDDAPNTDRLPQPQDVAIGSASFHNPASNSITVAIRFPLEAEAPDSVRVEIVGRAGEAVAELLEAEISDPRCPPTPRDEGWLIYEYVGSDAIQRLGEADAVKLSIPNESLTVSLPVQSCSLIE